MFSGLSTWPPGSSGSNRASSWIDEADWHAVLDFASRQQQRIHVVLADVFLRHLRVHIRDRFGERAWASGGHNHNNHYQGSSFDGDGGRPNHRDHPTDGSRSCCFVVWVYLCVPRPGVSPTRRKVFARFSVVLRRATTVEVVRTQQSAQCPTASHVALLSVYKKMYWLQK